MNNPEVSVSLKDLVQGVAVIDVDAALVATAASWFIGGWTLDAFAEALYLAGFAVILVGAIAGVVAALASRGQRESRARHRGNRLALVGIGAGMSLLAMSFILINSV